MKKIRNTMVFVVVLLFIGSGLQTLISGADDRCIIKNQFNEKNQISVCEGDILDQAQNLTEKEAKFHDNYMYAQSFVPTLAKLTRVEIPLKKVGINKDITITIRSEINGNDLTSSSKSQSQIPSETLEWVSFDFEDIVVKPGDTFYIIISTNGGNQDTDYYITWFTPDNPYEYGEAWQRYLEGDWSIIDFPNSGFPKMDFAFRTYGMQTFEITSIEGGFGITAEISNAQTTAISNLEWKIIVDGLIFLGAETTGTIDIQPESTMEINSDMIFGFGPVQITVEVDTKIAITSGFAIGPFILGIS